MNNQRHPRPIVGTPVLALSIILLVWATTACADFSTFQGDNQRSGNLSGEDGPGEPELIWSVSPTGHGYIAASAAVSGDRIFVPNWPDMTFKGELGFACLDKSDGRVLWLNPLGGKGGASTPALEGDRIYVGSLTGDIFCLESTSGETVWNRTIDASPKWWGVASSPLIQDGTVYVMSFSDGTLHALNLDGEELWNLSTGQINPYASPAYQSQRLYFPGGDPALYCIDSISKDVLWKAAANSQITATPTVEGDRVFLVTEETILALDTKSGEQVWTADINGTISSPAVSLGRVYAGSEDKPKGHLSCFDAESGSLIWRTEVNGPVKSSPLVLNGRLYFGTSCDSGTIYALEASNGSVVWTYPVDSYIMSSASASGGMLFIGADDGRLYAFGSSKVGLIWQGETVLEDGSLNLTASSGKTYMVNQTTALGALATACEQGGLTLGLNDSLYSLYGLQIESLEDYKADAGKSWRFWVNYPQESMPISGPDLTDLRDGDRVVFYYGDRRASPEEAPRVEISARVLQRRPAVLFLTVGNHPQIKEASTDAILNVTLVSPQNVTNLSSYELIFAEMIGAEAASRLEPLLQEEKKKGVPIVVLNSAGYEHLGSVNLSEHPSIQEYWDFGRTENVRRLFSYLAANFCGLNVKVEEPVPAPKEYMYHPDSPDLFDNLSSYLDWYQSKTGYHYNHLFPTIGVLSYYQDLGQPDRPALVRALEENGVNVIFAGYSDSSALQKFFTVNGTPIVDAVILTKSFRLNYGDPDQGIADLQELNVPVLRGMRLYYQTPEEWNNETGIDPLEIYFQIALPEMDGVIEPIVISGRNDSEYVPIESQMDWLADRAVSWADLGRTNDSQKKVAVIYYNHGGGKDNIEGCYINIPRSLQNILDGLIGAGYNVSGSVPDEKVLVDLLAHQGTNVGTWAPGELESMVAAGNATLIPSEDYEEWFSTLSQDKQDQVTKSWGAPPGEIMVYQNQSGKYLVIPKLSFGNVILLPQPTRGWLQNATILYHDKSVPPHHQYIAFYFWLKKGFCADAVVHLGKHGTQEWLPGKECGIGRDDWPALLIQDLPVVYPYIVDNIAEGTQAKRRGDAVMITHLTPPIVASGLYGNLTNLAEIVFEYRSVQNESVKESYKRQIVNLSRDMHLDEDLQLNLTNISGNQSEFDDFSDQLEEYLYDLKNQFMPYGLHVYGQPPEGQPLTGLVKSMLGDPFNRAVAPLVGYSDYPNAARMDKENELDNSTQKLLWETVINGTSPEEAQAAILGNVSGNVTDLLNLSLQYGRDIAACSAEVPSLANALDSNYTLPSPADDPIRDPQVLPTGRNFRSVDPRRVPTGAAWEVGSSLAEKLIDGYRQDHNGTYPRKLALVLWAWAMTDHGVVESEILKLVGAEPVYDAYGGVSDVRLIPLSELGRPRIDVVVVPSGLHRDLFPEKLQLIDKAVRLAANDTGTDYPNYVRENSEEIYQQLMEGGNLSQEEAQILSRSRIFLEEAGTYGPNLDSPVSASDTWENDTKLGDLFIRRMSYIYGDGIWSSKLASGEDLKGVQEEIFRTNLAEVDAAAQHTNSNLYGFIDNDDVFQYLGGIGLAVRTVTGKTPDMYVTDARDPDKAQVSGLKGFFSKELRSRYYNPQWIKGMMEQGYSGAREMDKFAEYLWGWETTVPDLVSENTWSEVNEIYVQDKYQMGLKEFFDQNNPWASQALAGRLLETARKDRWHPTEETKKELAERYEQSVQDYGVTCCHHTCGNLLLQEYMQGVLPSPEPQKSGSSSSKPSQSSSSKSGSSGRSHAYNQTRSEGVGTTASQKPVESDSSPGQVQGFVMEAVQTRATPTSASGAPLVGIGLVLMVLFMIWMGFRGKW
ncbi:MAG: PQQ-binding-like beta-propeller repeat protein [Methanotrichaceae archaeon]|nr:PQQ-binding-like beta-propeller repeat protein [Methanotrichaceae archaeon]